MEKTYKKKVINRRILAICFLEGYSQKLKINSNMIKIPGGSNHE
jgi:hypothetical protein